MGEVYRARDTRLERSVAIKVLPAEFANNAALKLRFEREAKTISSISHPHICSLFDIGNHAGTDYLVMELLEGETLADRLARGPLPMSDVLRLGAQIAEALAAAHRVGIVHRDLKPGNIMLTRSGAKLLDFGLAKTVGFRGGEQTEFPTEQKPITETGAILGTFQYMAPEQIEGLPADARTDIFALGAVLYEMATGQRAFSGKTRTSLIAAIVSAHPRPISELQPLTPPSFEQIVRSCLEKDPEDRFQSARDVAMLLRTTTAANAETAAARPRSSKTAWIIAAILLVALIGSVADRLRRRTEVPPTMRFSVAPPPGANFARTAAISPDGRKLVFRTESMTQPPSLWIRSLDSLATTPLAGTDGVSFVFWSPDGRHIGFISRNRLRRLDTNDGSIRVIVEGVSSLTGGASWSREGVIVFSHSSEGPLYRISAEGGEHVAVTRLEKGEKLHMWPWFLPDGRHFLFSVLGSSSSSGIYVGSIDSLERKRIVAHGPLPDMSRAVYGAGHLFYIRGRTLVAQPFDPDDLELRGSGVVVDESIELTGPLRTPLAVSDSGTLIYRKAGAPIVEQLALVDRAGREVAKISKPSARNSARISPDGKRILLGYDDPISSTWIYDVERDTETRMTFEHWAGLAAWVDDDALVYSAVTDTPPNLFLKRGNAPPVRLTNAPRQHYIDSVTRDGKYALYSTEEPETGRDLLAVSLTPPYKSIPLLHSRANEGSGHVSFDGKWLAYISNEGRTQQLYVTTFLRPGKTWQISSDVAWAPRWGGDGSLYFVGNDVLNVVRIGESGPGRPQQLFPLTGDFFDVGPKGEILIGERDLNRDSPPLTIVTNWR